MVEDTISRAASDMTKQKGYDFTAGFLCQQLAAAVAMLPKTKQKQFEAAFRSVVGQNVKVKVKNLMSGEEVEIDWDQKGGPCDPSTERFWSM